jgi:uncharacterized membrane protein YhaH (DUF805 family)
MSYLFGFSGRINRAKIWLFILVTLVWEMIIGFVAAVGFDWAPFMDAARKLHGPEMMGGSSLNLPAIAGPRAQIALGVIGVLCALYIVAFLAVYTKRLHDRNKSAWWLLPFVVIPWGLLVLRCIAVPQLLAMGHYFGPLGMGWETAHLVGAVLGLWAFIELFFFRGTAGENRYGPDPLA